MNYVRDAHVVADKLYLWDCDKALNCKIIRTLARCMPLKVLSIEENYRIPNSGSMGVSVKFAGDVSWTYGLVEASGVQWDGSSGSCHP